MRIENNRDNNNIQFGSLGLGECFEYNDNLYLRTECTLDSEGEVEYNSVMLADGLLTYFDSDYWVKNINAKIVIE